ncbi:MAG TPA: hypothetical protein ENG40_02850, partial [Thermoprotei archaeon]|nr:hypothetical protein [Thermoprotei archaeon]
MSIVYSAPGRIALFGEHMDWMKGAVIPAAIEMRTFLKACIRDDIFTEVYSYRPFTTYDKFYSNNPEPLRSGGDLMYVRAVYKAYSIIVGDPQSLTLRFMKSSDLPGKNLKDLPVKKGLSSSAAISVVTAAAIDLTKNFLENEVTEISLEKRKLYAKIAYTAERKLLGINCGQMDQYITSIGGLLYIDTSIEPAKPYTLKCKIDLPLVIGDTNQSKDTEKILAWLGDRFRKNENKIMIGREEIMNIVEEARKELDKENPNIYKIGELMNLNQYYLDKFLMVSSNCPISPNNLDKLINAALNAGALGAKLTGSGGGGSMIALTLPGDEKKIADAIKSVGGMPYITKVS